MNPSESIGTLVHRIECFRPTTANLVAGAILSALLIAAGVAALTAFAWIAPWSRADFDGGFEGWMPLGIWFAFGVGAIVGGIALVRFTMRLSKRKVDLCEFGLRCIDHDGQRDTMWSDVQEIRETIIYERMPILKGPANLITPKFASRDYTLVMTDGTQMEFDGNAINRIGRFAKLLRERAKELGVAWIVIDNK